LKTTDLLTEAEVSALNQSARTLPGLRAEIASRSQSSGKWLVILDDDPTGSQSVQNIPVVTSWTRVDLAWAFEQTTKAFFILTNSRAMNDDQARQVLTEVIESVEATAKEMGAEYSFMMRTDSTLRGHYELESNLLLGQAKTSSHPYDLMIFVPAYLDAGRITLLDVHWVKSGQHFIPVAHTDYAKDPAFCFYSSNLRDYVQERTGNRVSAQSVVSISLEDIRQGGVDAIAAKLIASNACETFIVNATSESDLDIVALASIQAEEQGKRILYRTGPSFVASRLGLPGRPPLSHDEIFAGHQRSGRGLIVVGSHVEITTRQLAEVYRRTSNLKVIEVDVALLLKPETANLEIERCVKQSVQQLANSEVLVATSRRIISGSGSSDSLRISQLISSALVEITRRALAGADVAWLIAKGGITSSDILTEAVEARRAIVAGQLFPGIVSVWVNQDQSNSRLTGLPLVVFAGNVGDESNLASAIEILRGRSK
jgi:uncharacterized protein YgbK (DUF1537 family)